MAGRTNLKIRLVITFVWLFLSGVVAAAEKHVPNQYPTIQAAINAASDGDTVLVANGTYYENITLKDGVQVRGAGADVTTIDGGRAGSVVTAIGVGPDTVLDRFTITNGGGSSGGGIYLDGGSPVITNNVVTQNRLGYSGSSGGGIYAYFSSATITHNTISNNSAEDGGGIYVTNWPSSSGPMPDIEYNNIYGNNSFAGGGIYLQISSPTVRGNTIAANTASAGGGIAANHSSSLIANNIIVSNSAGKYGGGGIWATNNSSPVIVSNTVVDNTASGSGTGIAVDNQFSLNITNCIVWGNGLYNCTATYSDIQGGYPGEGNINADPLFVNAAGGNLHLQRGSPCINAGNPNYVPGPYETDIDGDPRVIGLRIDMGADEVDTKLLVPTEYGTIQAAIDASVNGNTVIVAPGTYTGTGNRDIDFKGKAITVRSIDPNDPCVVTSTIIDCQADANNRHRGFKFVTGEDANSILSGITIISGNAPYENVLGENQDVGGALFCYESSPMITKCKMTNNSALRGGAISCCMSTGIIKDCSFTSNSAGYHGGAVYCRQSHVLIRNSAFQSNSAIYYGGAIYSYNGQDEIRECNIVSNNGGYGAGIAANQGETEIVDCIILNNNGERGGGICCGSVSAAQTNTPLVQRCLISGNSGSTRGGGINVGNNAIIKDCVVTHNQGVNGGGVGFLYTTDPIMTNSVIVGNTRWGDGGGGGISIQHGSRASVVNCTIANNETAEYGGVIDVYISTPLVANCIIWNNTAGEYGGYTIGKQICVSGNFITRETADLTLRYCDIEGGLANIKLQYEGKIGLALGNIDADPCFADPCSGDYHLLPASPCINAGDPNYVPELNETDIDGEPRVMLGRVDMGADEFNPFEIDFTVVNKRRVGRTLFEYDCVVTLTNVSRFAVSNVALEIVKASENMVLIDPTVTFGDIEIGPGESATSVDMCTFRVDRSQAIEPAEIIWKSTFEMADGSPGVQNTALGISFLNLGVAGDITGNGKADFEDLAVLADQWLKPPGTPSADIAPPPDGDNIVDFLDFAVLAQNWPRSTDE